MHGLTDDVALLRLCLDALRASGVDTDRLLARIGLTDQQLLAARLPHDAQMPFWRAAEEQLGQEHVGLHLVPFLPAFHGLLLEYLFLSSDTFGQGLRYALRYARLLSDALEASLVIDKGRAQLQLQGSERSPRHFMELLTGGLIRLFRALTNGYFRPLEITFMHPRGASAADYLQIYGCPVRLGAPCHSLSFDAEVLAVPSPYAAPQLLQIHDSQARRELAEVEKRDLVHQVRRLIGELVQEGATLAEVAARLHMPTRRLREQLAEAGARFNDLLDDHRCRLAKQLLLETDERIDSIVERTGFSEPSTFYRAFKRWVGETPVEFRKRGRLAEMQDS